MVSPPVRGSAAQAHRARLIRWRDDQTLDDLPDALLVVDAEGRVERCEAWSTAAEERCRAGGLSVESHPDRVIIPGLVDTHVHLPQLPIMGRHAQQLLEWLEQHVYPWERRFADAELAAAVADAFFAALLRHGTTTAAVHVTVHAAATHRAFEAARAAGIRAFIGKVMMDRECPEELREDPDESLERSCELAAAWHGGGQGLLQYVFTPRFLVSCTPQLLRRTREAADRAGCLLQTHLAENHAELERVRQLHGPASYAEVYADCGVLGPRSLLAHAVHLSDPDWDRVAASGSAIAFCPGSNFFLGSGSLALSRPRQRGVRVGLGSDGGAGPTLSLFHAMRDALYSQGEERPDPGRLLHLATVAGARALGLEGVVGRLLPGEEADFLVLDPAPAVPYVPAPPRDTSELLSTLVFRGDERCVARTYVRGRLVTPPPGGDPAGSPPVG